VKPPQLATERAYFFARNGCLLSHVRTRLVRAMIESAVRRGEGLAPSLPDHA
jgi:hypothetical protein